MLGFERITFDPGVMGGRACIRGMRVTVSLVVNLRCQRDVNQGNLGSLPISSLQAEKIRLCQLNSAFVITNNLKMAAS